jgi:hypothetical protein
MQSNDELRERLALLQEIKAVMAEMPDEDEMQTARDHLATLHAIKDMTEAWWRQSPLGH